MKIIVLYSTVSGNAEMVAMDIAAALQDKHDTSIHELGADQVALMSNADPDLFLFVCATSGEGEVPSGADVFLQALAERRIDLGGSYFAVFGLGNSSYETYNRGGQVLQAALSRHGAIQIGEYGAHDAISLEDPSLTALDWLQGVLRAAAATMPKHLPV